MGRLRRCTNGTNETAVMEEARQVLRRRQISAQGLGPRRMSVRVEG